jgi:hypothetical protein
MVVAESELVDRWSAAGARALGVWWCGTTKSGEIIDLRDHVLITDFLLVSF